MALTVEERLSALEKELGVLRTYVHELLHPNGDWLQRISGSMKDIPAPVFEEFKKYCAEIRRADQPVDEET